MVCRAELLAKAAAELQALQDANQALQAAHAEAKLALDEAGAAAEHAAQEKEAVTQLLSSAVAEKVCADTLRMVRLPNGRTSQQVFCCIRYTSPDLGKALGPSMNRRPASAARRALTCAGYGRQSTRRQNTGCGC